jgi:type III pantothenate kinase
MAELSLVAVSVGNTRTRVGVFVGPNLEESQAVANTDLAGAARAVLEGAAKLPQGSPVVIASVNDPVADRLAHEIGSGVRERRGEVYRFGRDLVIPVETALRDESAAATVGQDRLLNALGAYSRAKQACIVIDAGTAVTVDFVDGEGVFQGGAIAPGLNLMLRALHDHTAALPAVAYERAREEPGGQPFGKDSREAMLIGVRAAARGLAHELIDRYAEFFGAYPQVVATGGDARALFEGDEVVEHIVPDLTLLGIQAACAIQLGGGGDADADEPD